MHDWKARLINKLNRVEDQQKSKADFPIRRTIVLGTDGVRMLSALESFHCIF